MFFIIVKLWVFDLSIFVKSKYLFSIVIVYEYVIIFWGYVLLW